MSSVGSTFFRSIFKIAFMLLFFHHYNLFASAPLTHVLAHITLHKSPLLVAVLMTALVHCSHILRHVLHICVSGSAAQVLLQPPVVSLLILLLLLFILFFITNFTSRAVGMCGCVPLCQPTLTMMTPHWTQSCSHHPIHGQTPSSHSTLPPLR